MLLVVPAAPPAAAQPPARDRQPPQGGRSCQVQVDSVLGNANFNRLTDGTQQVFAGGGVFARCLNEPTTMQSDSMAYFERLGELRFIGRVQFRDSASSLDADRVTYWIRQERLYAEGNVYTRNLRTGSDLRGPNLDYYRAVPPLRDTLEIRASGRPLIHFYPPRDSGRDPGRAFRIRADRVRMRHTDRMWGGGRVEIDRADLTARSDSASLNLADSVATLTGGSPYVIGRDTTLPSDSNTYRLDALRIRFDLDGNQDVRRILAMDSAVAVGPDWRLTADTLDLTLDSSRVQRAQAWGTVRRPVATSGLNTVSGDSLDIQMPRQVMSQILSFGGARAITRDSARVEEDWLAGQDSLHARFAVTDSAGRRRSEVERVVAFGSARAYYHTENRRDATGPRGINYVRGSRIAIAMRSRRVRTVDVVGQVDGLYLEPLPTPPADTTRTDTTRADTSRVRPRPR